MFRGFIAIDIECLPKLVEFENKIKETGANIKLVEPKNIHITLKFLGDTNEEKIELIEEIIKKETTKVDPFKIQLHGTGVFPNQNYMKVLWIGIKNAERIGEIAEQIDRELSEIGFQKEKRKFSAHLTIGRVRSAKNKDKLLHIIKKYEEVEFGEIIVNSIKLKKSDLTPKGPIYTTLKEIKL